MNLLGFINVFTMLYIIMFSDLNTDTDLGNNSIYFNVLQGHLHFRQRKNAIVMYLFIYLKPEHSLGGMSRCCVLDAIDMPCWSFVSMTETTCPVFKGLSGAFPDGNGDVLVSPSESIVSSIHS